VAAAPRDPRSVRLVITDEFNWSGERLEIMQANDARRKGQRVSGTA
jgi:hypothetical protein